MTNVFEIDSNGMYARTLAAVPTAADPVAAWRALNAQHAAVHAALEFELRREHDLSDDRVRGARRMPAPPIGKARMQELAEAVHPSQSTVSRVVARLEDEGLACRTCAHDDRRGIFASITPAGEERRAAAAPTYRRIISDTLAG